MNLILKILLALKMAPKDKDLQEIYNRIFGDAMKYTDQFNIQMEHEINSISYLFIPEYSNNKLIIYHQGHGGDFYKGKDTIQFFLDKNYSKVTRNEPRCATNFGVSILFKSCFSSNFLTTFGDIFGMNLSGIFSS